MLQQFFKSMSNHLVISKHCKIANNKIFVNGKIVFENENLSFQVFIKNAYKQFVNNYPKFFKMDNLSKLGIITVELLSSEFKNIDGKGIGVLLVNSASSLDTDKIFQNTISDKTNYFPSPSIFVYTLPNIVIGEICIKYKIYGESSFFVSQYFDSKFIHTLTCDLFARQKIKTVIVGWLDFIDNEYLASLCIVKNNPNSTNNNNEIINFTIDNLEKIITK